MPGDKATLFLQAITVTIIIATATTSQSSYNIKFCH